MTIFTAPESNATSGKAILAMIMRRMRHELDKRRKRPAKDLGKLLILLDETARIVSAMRGASSGIACDETLAITSSFLRSMNRFWPWMPRPKTSGAAPRSTYHWLR